MQPHRQRVGPTFGVGLAGALALVTACGGPAPPVKTSGAPSASAPAAVAPVASAPPAFSPTEIAARTTPAVVSIRSPKSLGSGFVVRKNGWIATNFHVIAGATALDVVTSRGEKLAVVEVLAIDPPHDLAIVRVDVDDLPTVSVGDSEQVRQGDSVIAIGHPLGLEDTVSDGLISAIRKIEPTLTLLQISAPIAPGSSGGPLLDKAGQVIGVATLVSREGQNLNFGVPARYLNDLLAHPAPMPWKDFAARQEATALPKVSREIPHHELTLLKGCGEGDLRLVLRMIGEAIDVGAPLYNDGNFAACYHVYSGAAADAGPKLGAACTGPKKALADGQKKAASAATPAAAAWVMRDAFDGLIDVIHRKLGP